MAKVVKPTHIERCIGCALCSLSCSRTNFKEFSLKKSAIHIHALGGFKGRMAADIINDSKDPRAYKDPKTGEPFICTKCGACVNICPHKCLELVEESDVRL